MQSDRELLELAAKAAGIGDWVWDEQFLCMRLPPGAYTIAHTQKHWTPLTDDGDALRLAVKLNLSVELYPIYDPIKHAVIVKQRRRSDTLRERNPTEMSELCGDDPYAATRRAIVRTAAEIGRMM